MVIQFDDFWSEFCKAAKVDENKDETKKVRLVAECAWDAALISVITNANSIIMDTMIGKKLNLETNDRTG